MGGCIPIAARFNNGDVICVDGWTNFMPDMIKNQATLSGDDSVVRKTLTEIITMDGYEGLQPFRAYGYGMVVIDFISKQIHSMQGYCNLDGELIIQMRDKSKTGFKSTSALSDRARDLIAAGRAHLANWDFQPIPGGELTIDNAQDYLNMAYNKPLINMTPEMIESAIECVAIDLDPFVLHEYPEGTSLTLMKDRLRAVGFPLTKADGLNKAFSDNKND